MSSRSWSIARHHSSLTLRLEQHAVVAVVVGRADAAVDLRGGEDEAAPLAQRDDLVHGHDVGWRHRERGSAGVPILGCHADLRVPRPRRHDVRGHAEDDRRPADACDPETACRSQRVFHPVAVHFKGRASTTPTTGRGSATARRRRREVLGLGQTRRRTSSDSSSSSGSTDSSSSSLVVLDGGREDRTPSSSRARVVVAPRRRRTSPPGSAPRRPALALRRARRRRACRRTSVCGVPLERRSPSSAPSERRAAHVGAEGLRRVPGDPRQADEPGGRQRRDFIAPMMLLLAAGAGQVVLAGVAVVLARARERERLVAVDVRRAARGGAA